MATSTDTHFTPTGAIVVAFVAMPAQTVNLAGRRGYHRALAARCVR